MLTADMGPGEQKIVAQEIAQQHPRLDLAPMLRAVHGHADVVHIGSRNVEVPPVSGHGEPVRVR